MVAEEIEDKREVKKYCNFIFLTVKKIIDPGFLKKKNQQYYKKLYSHR